MSRIFTSRIYISGRLHLDTALRIGVGKSNDVAGVDMPVLRDAIGNPIIPGSSMKGVLRSYLEAVFSAFQKADSPFENSPFHQVYIPDNLQRRIESAAQRKEIDPRIEGRTRLLATDPFGFDEKSAPLDHLTASLIDTWKKLWEGAPALHPGELDELIINSSALTEILFGTPWLAARAFIRDLPLSSGQNIRMGNRNGVGIHRGTRTAKNKALYDFEVVPAGTSFDFEMTLENTSDVETGAVLVGIKALQRGDLQVGGGTSRGLGGVHLAEWQVRRLTPDNLGAYLFEDQKGETVEENALRSQYYAAFQQAIEA